MSLELTPVIDYASGISAIDSGYVRPYLDAIYLMQERDRAAIIDTGTNRSVPAVLAALEAKNLDVGQIDYIILTHVHLDHAGGAGQLMSLMPNARLVVHPRGARHMIDPARLIEGTIAVYGAKETERTHGTIIPVPEERVLIANDLDAIELAGRRLEFYDTPGHARHHNCIYDRATSGLFAGDMFGLSYRELDRDGRAFVFPATTPVQFDPAPFHASIERLMALEPASAFLTHYGKISDLSRISRDLLRLVDAHAALANEIPLGLAAGEAFERLRMGVSELVRCEAAAQHWRLEADEAVAFMQMDITLNAQGLVSWLQSLKKL
jgi:hydroxyacylglutathione hydrolase